MQYYTARQVLSAKSQFLQNLQGRHKLTNFNSEVTLQQLLSRQVSHYCCSLTHGKYLMVGIAMKMYDFRKICALKNNLFKNQNTKNNYNSIGTILIMP